MSGLVYLILCKLLFHICQSGVDLSKCKVNIISRQVSPVMVLICPKVQVNVKRLSELSPKIALIAISCFSLAPRFVCLSEDATGAYILNMDECVFKEHSYSRNSDHIIFFSKEIDLQLYC